MVLVKTLSGKTIVVNVNEDDTVDTVRQRIAEKENLPVDQQRLIYSGKHLEGSRKLSDYNINDNSTLNLLATLRGGI